MKYNDLIEMWDNMPQSEREIVHRKCDIYKSNSGIYHPLEPLCFFIQALKEYLEEVGRGDVNVKELN